MRVWRSMNSNSNLKQRKIRTAPANKINTWDVVTINTFVCRPTQVLHHLQLLILQQCIFTKTHFYFKTLFEFWNTNTHKHFVQFVWSKQIYKLEKPFIWEHYSSLGVCELCFSTLTELSNRGHWFSFRIPQHHHWCADFFFTF